MAGIKRSSVAVSDIFGSSKTGNDKSHGADSAWVLRLQHRRQKVAEHIAPLVNQLCSAWFRFRVSEDKAASHHSTSVSR
jgi:hypothetical protein